MEMEQTNGSEQDQRYSAKKTIVPVSFMCSAPDAREVFIIGDFNGWDPAANAMKKGPDGTWQSSFPVHSGHHRYQFLIDGVPHLDPRARGVVRMENEAKASLLSVS